MKEIKQLKYILFSSILVAMGPLIWLFINIYDKNYDKLTLNVILLIISIAVVLFNFKIYLKSYNRKNNIFLEILNLVVSFLFYITLIAVYFIVFMAFYIGIIFIQEKIFIMGEYLTFMIKSPYYYLLFVILILVVSEIKHIFSKVEKFNKYIIPIIILLIYIIITSIVVVTEDGIYEYSFYNLKGNKYEFSDVEYVSTGFVGKGRNKGEFFYNIELKDGKKLKLAHPSMTHPSSKYGDNTWQEYVDIDELIMKEGAKKSASEEGYEYTSMDKIYVDKLLKVVRNK